jgi:hypothetical protein
MSAEHPKFTDAVLGDNQKALPSSHAAVLGGFDRLAQEQAQIDPENLVQQQQFFYRAINYGYSGIEQVVMSVQSAPLQQVRDLAWQALSHRPKFETLQILLQRSLWRLADEMTGKLMLQQVEALASGRLTIHHLRHYDCQHLQKIDQIWLEQSGGRFGLTVQAKLWAQFAPPDGTATWPHWCQFGERIGWCDRRQNWRAWNDLRFVAKAPIGHLPRTVMLTGWGLGDFRVGCVAMSTLHQRLQSCGLVGDRDGV